MVYSPTDVRYLYRRHCNLYTQVVVQRGAMKPLRSLLFVPGSKPAWMEKALSYGADALIFDLEDSVPNQDKAAARVHVRQALDRLHDRGPLLTVRINALNTGLAGDDLA